MSAWTCAPLFEKGDIIIEVGVVMENSYRFFENRDCKFFPCHNGLEDLNCLFCYCPLNRFENCPGSPEYIKAKGKIIKDCSNCTFPHRPENYDRIIQFLVENQ